METHNFLFEGGYDLRRISVSWFVSYAYYEYVDREHKNWSFSKTAKSRISKYNSSKKYHILWLEKVKDMSLAALSRNEIGLKAEEIKKMSLEILQVLNN